MLFAQNAPLFHETAVMIWPSGGHLEKAAIVSKKIIGPISNINQYKKLY